MRCWFDQIRDGIKTTEYRVASKRIDSVCAAPYIKFVNAYTANAPFLVIQCVGWATATLEEVAAASIWGGFFTSTIPRTALHRPD